MKTGFGAVTFSAVFLGLAQCLAHSRCPFLEHIVDSLPCARLEVADTAENKLETLWKVASDTLGPGPHAATFQLWDLSKIPEPEV